VCAIVWLSPVGPTGVPRGTCAPEVPRGTCPGVPGAVCECVYVCYVCAIVCVIASVCECACAGVPNRKYLLIASSFFQLCDPFTPRGSTHSICFVVFQMCGIPQGSAHRTEVRRIREPPRSYTSLGFWKARRALTNFEKDW
jgi:hypothetical protein